MTIDEKRQLHEKHVESYKIYRRFVEAFGEDDECTKLMQQRWAAVVDICEMFHVDCKSLSFNED